jgi:transposase InsO family protein
MDDDLRESIALFRYGVISEFVSRTLAPGEKERLLEWISRQSWTIPGTQRIRIGASTAKDWVAQYEAMGFEGLKPRRRSDAGTSRALSDVAQDVLLGLRHERPKASVASLIRATRLSGKVEADEPLAASTVYRFLDRHGFSRPAAQGQEADAKAFTHPHTGDLWMVDVMHGPRLLVPGRQKGPKSYLIAFFDDASRLVPYAAFYPAENSSCFQDSLKHSLLRRGVPHRLYCDNGSAFRSKHLQVVCATLNIALIHSRPGQPRGRGKNERFFRTVRTSFLPHLDEAMLSDLAALNRVFWAWLESEYHQTPHRGLSGKTPQERFLEDLEWIREAPEDLERMLRMKVKRSVAKDRTIRLESRYYECPDGFAGEKVEVLYDPYDPRQPVHIRRRGESQEHLARPLDLHTNATLRRAPREASAPEKPPVKTGISYLDLIAKQFYGDHEE